MKKWYLAILLISLLADTAWSQYYRPRQNNGQRINTCKGQFVASNWNPNMIVGSSMNGYFNNENNTVTFCNPSGGPIRANFYWIDIEQGYDYLYVYNGPNTSSPLAGTFTGLALYPGVITSTGSCLTFRFRSDGIENWSGFNVLLGCPPPTCGSNTIASDNCAGAPLICNLNGYCGSTSGWYTRDNGQIEGSTWGGNNVFNCGSIQNNSWIAFEAAATTATLNISTSNCSNGSSGIQAAILRSTNCNTFTRVSTCVSTLATSFNLTGTGLTPGEKYYLMIDGIDGNDCDYEVKAVSGIETVNINSNLSGSPVCSGQTFTLNAFVSGSGGPYGYQWSPEPVSGQGTSSATYVASTTQPYQVTVSGACNSSQTSTYNQVISSTSVSVSGATTICEGASTTLTANGSVNPSTISFTNNTPMVIPDNDATGVTSTINVPGLPGTVGSQLVSVCLNISHLYASDLEVQLRCPNGNIINLIMQRGGLGSNFVNTCLSTSGIPVASGTAPFTGTFTPEQALSLLSGCNLSGNWSLIVKDRVLYDGGILQSWSLTFQNAIQYTWSPADGLSATNTPSVTASPAGTTTYTVTSSDLLGCTNSTTHTLNVTPVVEPLFNPVPDLCQGDPAPILPAVSTNGISGTWSPATVSNNASGTYTFTPGSGNCILSPTLNVNVIPKTIISPVYHD